MAKENKNVFIQFFKRYGYYLLLVTCILALAFLITFSVIYSGTNTKTEPVSSPTQITFINPVISGTVIKEYSNTELQYNQTLNQWEAHFGIDFSAVSGTNVVACYNGVVESVYSNTLEGSVVVLNHGNGLKTVYKSLTNVKLSEGTNVNQGDVLGQVSTSASSELKDGDHVHFEVWKDGSRVDPDSYLNIVEK